MDADRLEEALRGCRDGSEPAVVTLASCDSGKFGTPLLPGASLAHGLHEKGISLVVASQHPLSHAGSAVLTEVLYERLLRGDDPR